MLLSPLSSACDITNTCAIVKLRTKILSTYIGLAVVGVVLVGVLSSWQIKRYLEERIRRDLSAHVTLLVGLYQNGALAPDLPAAMEMRLRAIAGDLGIRVTVLRKEGTVIFDSGVRTDSLPLVENHLNRPEVRAAGPHRIGTNMRHSNTVGINYLYAAQQLTGANLGELDSGYVRAALPVTELEQLDSRVQWTVAAVGVLTICLIAFASMRLSTKISHPLLELVDTAQAITRGDVSKRAHVPTNDEIGLLSSAINEMAGKLGNDITQLQKLESVRSEFLGNVSHELRTPIFSIQGFLETLLDGAMDDPSVNREFLEKAHRHAERLNALLNDLIEISRIESGEMKMSFRYFSVREFVEQMAEEMRPAAAKKQITITVDSEVDNAAQVYGDKERLRQVMVNLIDNSVKYTEPGGTVRCTIGSAGVRTHIRVQDTGCGIAPEHLSRIFERFYRVDRDRSREVGGTGLGLAIVKHIVEAHGGTISVESVVGKGSSFTFALKN